MWIRHTTTKWRQARIAPDTDLPKMRTMPTLARVAPWLIAVVGLAVPFCCRRGSRLAIYVVGWLVLLVVPGLFRRSAHDENVVAAEDPWAGGRA